MANSQQNSGFDVDSFLDTCKHNLLTLQENLSNLGYRFLNTSGPLHFADRADCDAIAATQQRFGTIPLLIRRWYQTFRSVDFSQDPRQLRDPTSAVGGLGYNVTLVLRDINWCTSFRDELIVSGVMVEREAEHTHLLPFGTFASNCEPKGVWIPDDSVDPAIYNDGGGPVLFSDELRVAFRSGGFPFWDCMLSRRRFTSPLGFSPQYRILRELLRQGMKQL